MNKLESFYRSHTQALGWICPWDCSFLTSIEIFKAKKFPLIISLKITPTFQYIFFPFFKVIGDLQCCANFCSTANRRSHTCIYIPFYITFHQGLSQEIGYSSLCCTVGPCCLSILNIIVWHLLSPKSQSIPLPAPLPWQPQVGSLCRWVCFCFGDRFVCAIHKKWYHMVFVSQKAFLRSTVCINGVRANSFEPTNCLKEQNQEASSEETRWTALQDSASRGSCHPTMWVLTNNVHWLFYCLPWILKKNYSKISVEHVPYAMCCSSTGESSE